MKHSDTFLNTSFYFLLPNHFKGYVWLSVSVNSFDYRISNKSKDCIENIDNSVRLEGAPGKSPRGPRARRADSVRYLTIINYSVTVWSAKLDKRSHYHHRWLRLQEQYFITELCFTGVGAAEAISGQYFRQTRAGAAAPSSHGHLLTRVPRAPVHYKRGLPKTLLHQASFVSSTDNMRAPLALAFLALARAAIIGMFFS